MEKSLMVNRFDEQYIKLLIDILDKGTYKETRNGTTYSLFGITQTHKMADGFPLLTTKKMAIKSAMSELKWFLSGSTDIRELRAMGCHIWDGDCYASYVRTCQWEFEEPMSKEEFFELIDNNDSFGKTWGDMGPIYGHQWRNWGGRLPFVYGSLDEGIDQLNELLETLKTDPDSRRLIVNSWNVDQIDEMKLPPCHYGFQLYTRKMSDSERWTEYVKSTKDKHIPYHDRVLRELDEIGFPTRKISLMWSQRSADVPLGLPFNWASYGMLLSLFAKEVNMIPDELTVNIGDAHIYENQIEGVKQQRYNPMFPLPTVEIKTSNLLEGKFDYEIKNYVSCSPIKFPLSN